SVPFIDEGVACDDLRLADDRDQHQSLVGRAASSRFEPPVSLTIESTAITQGGQGQIIVTIGISNETLGTIPILITEDSVLVNEGNGQAGLGVAFNNTGNIANATTGNPASEVRLLGPRQRCVHRVSFQVSQLPGPFRRAQGPSSPTIATTAPAQRPKAGHAPPFSTTWVYGRVSSCLTRLLYL
ncbi:hypothetical protein HC928_12820, partial [bacterium]|nr:hypothetical protein [bacterium]